MKVVYISDFLYKDVQGGAELNDHILCASLSASCDLIKIYSYHTESIKTFLNKGNFFIISNFTLMNEDVKKSLCRERYIIYEHDHKYIKSRDPALYVNYKAEDREIINKEFYNNALAVFCQSIYQSRIMYRNVQNENIYNVSGNFWDDETLDLLLSFSKKEKKEQFFILKSQNQNKNTTGAVNYCKKTNLKYHLSQKVQYHSFLEEMSESDKFLFLPKTPETLARVCVEAKIMGVKVHTNSKVGASFEEWFAFSGVEIVRYLKDLKERVTADILKLVNGKEIKYCSLDALKPEKVSIITSMFKGEEYVEKFLKNITEQTVFDEQCELIIVDANSPQNEYEIIKKYLNKHSNIKYFKLKEDPGIYGCWNYAIKKAKYKLITNANLDDLRDKRHIEKLSTFMLDNPWCDLVYPSCYVSKRRLEQYDIEKIGSDIYPVKSFTKQNMIKCLPGCMPLWRKQMHTDHGLFNDFYNYAGDHEMWLRAVRGGSKFFKFPQALGAYFMNPNGLSTSKEKSLERFEEERRVFWEYSDVFGLEETNKYRNYFSR